MSGGNDFVNHGNSIEVRELRIRFQKRRDILLIQLLHLLIVPNQPCKQYLRTSPIQNYKQAKLKVSVHVKFFQD